MIIRITGLAFLVDEETEEELADATILKSVDGYVYDEEKCSDYLDEEDLETLDITGGLLRYVFNRHTRGLNVVTEYEAPRRLTDSELMVLITHTVGQWTDGIGENGASVEVQGRTVYLDPSRNDEETVTVEQLDEGTSTPQPRFINLFRAARTGDVDLLAKALDSGEEINAKRAQIPALNWAICYGQVDAALMLIQRGADVEALDIMSNTPLHDCAASNSISDADALRVAEALIANSATVDDETLELARNRGKDRLAAFLDTHREKKGTAPGQAECNAPR